MRATILFVAKILIIDDELSMREFLQILLQNDGYDVVTAPDVKSGIEACGHDYFDLVITDLKLPDGSGLEVLSWVSEHQADTQVILLTAYASTQNAVEAMRLGAYDYQIKPVKVDEIRALSEKALEKVRLLRENRQLSAKLRERKQPSRFSARSPRMERVMTMVEKVADATTSVLIEGESGTGKELVARTIHETSSRRARQFVPVNCGAIPESLIESELFGHKVGAFTGASKDRGGLFEAAHGGTLLLDEIGELPLSVQVKLLRVLQERTVRRVGEDRERPVDVRILAATNRDLEKMVEDGTFREDLYYRLNVVKITVPPLRERIEDIPILVKTFMMKYAQELGKEIQDLSREALDALCRYGFPGNVRELENYIQRAVTLASGKVIGVDDLPEQVCSRERASLEDLLYFPAEGLSLDERLSDLERRYMEESLRRCNGVKKHAAKLLGMSFRSFRYRLQKAGVAESGETLAPERESLG